MKLPYKSRNPNAGVLNYEITATAIILEFRDAKFRYVYDATNPGPDHVAAMIHLARAGEGLSTYVNQHVRERYARKLPLRSPEQ
jgi:hypothetical protein